MLPIPRYKELGVKPVWELVRQVPELTIYFPTFKDKELPDRSFLWGVLGTLKRDACEQLLAEARAHRGKSSEENKDELIEIHPEFLKKILEAPTIPKSKICIHG